MTRSLRTLALIALTGVLLSVVIGSAATYRLLGESLHATRREAAEQLIEVLAAQIADWVKTQQHTLGRLATSAELAAVLTTPDRPEARLRKAEELRRAFPAALRLSVLPPASPSTAGALHTAPCLVLAERLLREHGEFVMTVHAAADGERHLDLIQPVHAGGADRPPSGLILASLDASPLQERVERLRPKHSALTVQQPNSAGGTLIVATAGILSRHNGLTVTRPIAHTPWEVTLGRPAESVGPPPGEKLVYAGLLLLAVLIPILGTIYVHLAIGRAIDHDLKSVARIFQDVRHGNMRVDYPMELAESRKIFDHLRRSGQKLVLQQRRFRDLGLYDHLSQLHNRRAFEQKLAELFERSRMAGPSSVLIIDLDHFKAVNDRHGHDVGDALITEFSQILRGVVRASDFVARLGGDEFCVIFPHTGLDPSIRRAERLREELPEGILLNPGYEHRLRWTAGLAEMQDGDTRYDQVLWRADQALLKAKELGRNRTCCYADSGPREISAPADEIG